MIDVSQDVFNLDESSTGRGAQACGVPALPCTVKKGRNGYVHFSGVSMSQDLAWRNLLKEQSWMQEAMDAANTGLWVIMIDTRNGCCSMLASAPMLRLLGLEE